MSRWTDVLLLRTREPQDCLKRVEATVRLATPEESRCYATRQGQVAALLTWSQSLHRLEIFLRFITVANLLIINTNSVFFPRFAKVPLVFSRLTKVPRVFPPSALVAHFQQLLFPRFLKLNINHLYDGIILLQLPLCCSSDLEKESWEWWEMIGFWQQCLDCGNKYQLCAFRLLE